MLNDLSLLMKDITLIILLAPLLGCLIAGLLGYKIGRFWTSFFTILFLAVSLGLSIYLMLKMTTEDFLGVSGNVKNSEGINIFTPK